MLTKAEQAKALEAQRDLLLNQVDTLKARIVIKESIISVQNEKLEAYKNIVSSKDAIISTQVDQRKIFEQNTAALNHQLKVQKRKTRFVSFIGLVTTGLMAYLFISK